MAYCPFCGKEMFYEEKYGQWYCFTCRQYHQPPKKRRATRKLHDTVVTKKTKRKKKTPMQILDERLAKGEIDLETYKEIKKELQKVQD